MNIEKVSVRIMRSYNYNNFEVCLEGTGDPSELRRECQRLVDEALEAYKQAREMEAAQREVQMKEFLEKDRQEKMSIMREDCRKGYEELSLIPEEDRSKSIKRFISDWESGKIHEAIDAGYYVEVPSQNEDLPF